jgi:type II secretory pathway component PulJ
MLNALLAFNDISPCHVRHLVPNLQVLKASAASQDELQQAESHLQRAIAAAAQLAEQQDGLLLESNKACAADAEAADGARSTLAMLLCQSGREAEAAVHLAALGFKFRLSNEVRQSHWRRSCQVSPSACYGLGHALLAAH